MIKNKVYGVCSYESNSMKSSNPHSGFYEAETARTLDANGGNPTCNQGGMLVVQKKAVYPEITGSLMASGYNKLGTQEAMNDMYVVEALEKSEPQPVASFYPQMKAESQCFRDDGICNTLVVGTNPGFHNGVVIALDRAAYNQGENAQFDFCVSGGGTAPTIIAKGPGAVCYRKPSEPYAMMITNSHSNNKSTKENM